MDAVDGMRLARAQGCGAVKFFVPKHADLGSRFDALAISMTTEHELREKLRKISALFEGATTIGERHARRLRSIGCEKLLLSRRELNSR